MTQNEAVKKSRRRVRIPPSPQVQLTRLVGDPSYPLVEKDASAGAIPAPARKSFPPEAASQMEMLGRQYGHLIVLASTVREGWHQVPGTRYLCQCACGNVVALTVAQLEDNALGYSCGCLVGKTIALEHSVSEHTLRSAVLQSVLIYPLSIHQTQMLHVIGSRRVRSIRQSNAETGLGVAMRKSTATLALRKGEEAAITFVVTRDENDVIWVTSRQAQRLIRRPKPDEEEQVDGYDDFRYGDGSEEPAAGTWADAEDKEEEEEEASDNA